MASLFSAFAVFFKASNMNKKTTPPHRNRPGQNVDASFHVRKLGLRTHLARDSYHFFHTAPWISILLLLCFGFILANGIFAFAYLLGGDCIANARSGSFSDAFFFSVQTMATIG